MKRIKLNYNQLKNLAKFTDPFIHSYEKEEEILSYFRYGQYRPPSLIEHNQQYLIFNGNHRVMVAINYKLTILCNIIENIDDIIQVQHEEGKQYRDISMILPLTFEGVIQDLIRSAKKYNQVDPSDYSYKDF
jgi:hypothetical protein